MAEHGNHRPEDEDPLLDEQERGRGPADEEFEEEDEDFDEEDESEDQDLSVQRDLISDAGYTGEIGSEGGSRGGELRSGVPVKPAPARRRSTRNPSCRPARALA